MTADELAPPSRRERKKQRTREALIEAAFTLFAQKGFEATTVEEIADEVDVSARTFFRYFTSKEDVALTFQEEQFAALTDALAARPPGEPVMTAIKNAAVDMIGACERGDRGFDPERFMCMQKLMATSPALLARSLELAQKKHAVLTRFVADRMGVDPASDLRPHVVAGAATNAFRAAADAWHAGVTSAASVADAVEQAFSILEGGLNYP